MFLQSARGGGFLQFAGPLNRNVSKLETFGCLLNPEVSRKLKAGLVVPKRGWFGCNPTHHRPLPLLQALWKWPLILCKKSQAAEKVSTNLSWCICFPQARAFFFARSFCRFREAVQLEDLIKKVNTVTGAVLRTPLVCQRYCQTRFPQALVFLRVGYFPFFTH